MKLRNLLVMLLLLTGTVVFAACEGKDGKDGVDGKDGAQGPAGPKGDKGDPGPAGADGRDGADSILADPRCRNAANGIQALIDTAGSNNIQGTDDDEVICGSKWVNDIRTGGGDDFAYGGDGGDKMIGEAGDDTLYGEGGNDHFFLHGDGGNNKYIGGSGDDLVYFMTAPNVATTFGATFGNYYTESLMVTRAVTFDLSTGSFDSAGFFSPAGTFTFEGIENIFSGTGDDNLIGDDGDNYIFGHSGTDTINGKEGDDVLAGGAGVDTLNGGAGADVLYGFSGNDVLTGGDGADIFLIRKDQGLDVIKDFDLTEDKIYFRDFPTGDTARAITVAGGQISVGGTAHVEIHDAAGMTDNDKAMKIKDDPTRYRFVASTFKPKTQTFTFTDN